MAADAQRGSCANASNASVDVYGLMQVPCTASVTVPLIILYGIRATVSGSVYETTRQRDTHLTAGCSCVRTYIFAPRSRSADASRLAKFDIHVES
ncbi:hypothetical protein ACG7TL_008766 [Trametes sanguinea]